MNGNNLITARGIKIAYTIGVDYVGYQDNERGKFEYYLFNLPGTDITFTGTGLITARRNMRAAKKRFGTRR